MESPLIDRVVVVTGGFGALGRALASVLADKGARVALLDRAPAAGDMAGDDRTLLLGGVDLGDAAAVQTAFAQVAQRWQHIDGLVNVAGGFEGDIDGEGHRGHVNGWKAANLPWRQG